MRAFESADIPAKIVYECSVGQTLAAMAEAGLGVAIFGDTVDLRAFTLSRRELTDVSGNPLTFDLYVAWLRDAIPAWVHDFAVELATFSRGCPASRGS